MKQFLLELAELMEKYDCCIVNPADETNKLSICDLENNVIYFDEEINQWDLKREAIKLTD